MRRVVLQVSVSLDGFLAREDGDLDWGLAPEHPDVTGWKLASLRQVGTHVMGRVTYEGMAAHWQSATDGYAAPMNELPKVVFSKTLESAEWRGSRIARGDLGEEITSLKRESGGHIMAHGGARFVQALSKLDLIDEYRLVIHPVALGNGLPLFKDLPAPLHLELLTPPPIRTAPPSMSTGPLGVRDMTAVESSVQRPVRGHSPQHAA